MLIQFRIITIKNRGKQARRLTHVRKHARARACGNGSGEGGNGEGCAGVSVSKCEWGWYVGEKVK